MSHHQYPKFNSLIEFCGFASGTCNFNPFLARLPLLWPPKFHFPLSLSLSSLWPGLGPTAISPSSSSAFLLCIRIEIGAFPFFLYLAAPTEKGDWMHFCSHRLRSQSRAKVLPSLHTKILGCGSHIDSSVAYASMHVLPVRPAALTNWKHKGIAHKVKFIQKKENYKTATHSFSLLRGCWYIVAWASIQLSAHERCRCEGKKEIKKIDISPRTDLEYLCKPGDWGHLANPDSLRCTKERSSPFSFLFRLVKHPSLPFPLYCWLPFPQYHWNGRHGEGGGRRI